MLVAASSTLNAANEVAVQAFLDGNLGFTGIPARFQQPCSAIGAPVALALLDDVPCGGDAAGTLNPPEPLSRSRFLRGVMVLLSADGVRLPSVLIVVHEYRALSYCSETVWRQSPGSPVGFGRSLWQRLVPDKNRVGYCCLPLWAATSRCSMNERRRCTRKSCIARLQSANRWDAG